MKFCTNAIGWWNWILGIWGRRFCVDVPACVNCHQQVSRNKWMFRILTWGFLVVGVGFSMYLLAGYQGYLWRWLALGITLICVSPLLMWQTFFPPVFDMTAYSKTVDYEFRDPAYAVEFTHLNGVSIDDIS